MDTGDRQNYTGGTLVPPFHLETNQRKWGEMNVEVVSVHCSLPDTRYMKYLLVEASSQSKITKGVFVPSGIHLMEGKQVLTQILQEQQEFVQDMESFHIEGIMEEDMYSNVKDNETILEKILLKGPGVQAIKPTYQTKYKGQWILVVKGRKLPSLTEHIKENMSRIYHNKKGRQPRLFTHQLNSQNGGYKLSIFDKTISKVGTYTKVLKRRFQPPTNTTKHVATTEPMKHNADNGNVWHTKNGKHNSSVNDKNGGSYTRTGTTQDKARELNTDSQKGDNNSAENNQRGTNALNKRDQDDRQTIGNNADEKRVPTSTDQTQDWTQKIQTMEKNFMSKIENMAQENKK